jgi:hypothetical protein
MLSLAGPLGLNAVPNVPSVVANEETWCGVERRVAQLLRRPLLRRVVGHSMVDDFAGLVLDDDESENLPVVTLPRLSHVLLDRPLRHPDTELEQFSAGLLGTPEAVFRRA